MKNILPVTAKDLESLRVKNACPKNWDDMKGNDQKRFCEHCNLHVHNLSAMSSRQVKNLSLIRGRRCVTYFQNEDGSIRLRSRFAFLGRSFSRTRRLAASLLALLFPFSFVGCDPKSTSPEVTVSPETTKPPVPPVEERLTGDVASPVTPVEQPIPVPTPEPEIRAMGEAIAPTPPPAPAPPVDPAKKTDPDKKKMTTGY